MSSPTPPPSYPASYPAPGPPGPPYWGPQYQQPPFDGLSIAGFVTSFVVAPVGFVLSVVGLLRTRRHGTRGRGLAIAGIVIGAAGTAYYALVIGLVVFAGVVGSFSHTTSSRSTSGPSTSGPVGDYLLAVQDLDGDTYDAYADDDLVTWGHAACTDLDGGSDARGTRLDLHQRYDLTGPETTTVVVAAATTLCPAHAGDVPSGSSGDVGT